MSLENESNSKQRVSHPKTATAHTQLSSVLGMCWSMNWLVKCSGGSAWSYLTVFAIIRHGPAGERVLLRLGFGFPDSFQPLPVLLTDLQSMLWVSSPERTEDGTSPERESRQWYLLAEKAIHQEDEDTLQAVDDGEEVGHDVGSRSHLQESQKPRASQDEELSCGFKCQHPGWEEKVSSWYNQSHSHLHPWMFLPFPVGNDFWDWVVIGFILCCQWCSTIEMPLRSRMTFWFGWKGKWHFISCKSFMVLCGDT